MDNQESNLPDDYIADLRDARRIEERKRGCKTIFNRFFLIMLLVSGLSVLMFWSYLQNVRAQTSPIPPRGQPTVTPTSMPDGCSTVPGIMTVCYTTPVPTKR